MFLTKTISISHTIRVYLHFWQFSPYFFRLSQTRIVAISTHFNCTVNCSVLYLILNFCCYIASYIVFLTLENATHVTLCTFWMFWNCRTRSWSKRMNTQIMYIPNIKTNIISNQWELHTSFTNNIGSGNLRSGVVLRAQIDEYNWFIGPRKMLRENWKCFKYRIRFLTCYGE